MGEKSDPMNMSRAARSAGSGTGDAALDPISDAGYGQRVDTGDRAVSANHDDSDVNESIAEIRENIESTRADMSGTINAIEERLSPRRLVNEATETVRDATVGKVRDVMNSASDSAGGIVERVKGNPVPAALIGLGAWWLFRKNDGSNGNALRSHRQGADLGAGHADYRFDAAEYPDNSDGLVGMMKQHPVSVALAGLSAALWLTGQRGGNGSRAGAGRSGYPGRYPAQPGRSTPQNPGTTEKLGEMAHDATEAVSDLAERTQERVGYYTDRAQTEFDRLLNDNPFALAAVAVVVGAAVGMAVPETESERQMIGGVHDQLVEKAQDLAQGVAEKVQQLPGSNPGPNS